MTTIEVLRQKEPRRYRMVDVGCDGEPQRVLVVKHHGFEGYIARWTGSCSGCCELGDYGSGSENYSYDPKARCLVGAGCEECGFTGKRRNEYFVPFDHAAFEAFIAAESKGEP
jgi:hypothetical protein